MSRKEKRCITSAVAESAKKNEKRLENCGKKSQLKSIYQVKNRVTKNVTFTQTGLVHKAQTLSSFFGVLNTDSRCEWRASCHCSVLLYKKKHQMTVITGEEALLVSANDVEKCQTQLPDQVVCRASGEIFERLFWSMG